MIRAGENIRHALTGNPERVLLHGSNGESRTGRQILQSVERLAGALIEMGHRGAKIGLWYWNGPAAVEAFLAAEWIGGTRVPVDPGAPPAEAKAVFDAAGVDVVLTDRAHEGHFAGRGFVHEIDQPLEGKAMWPAVEVEPDRTFLLYPRSVTGGRLFAIPVSYGNWQAITRTNIALFRSGRYGEWAGEKECFLNAQQIMHGTGFMGTFAFLSMGLPQIVFEKFDAEGIVDAIARHGVTATMLAPLMLSKLVDAAEKRPEDVKSLRHVLYGGGPVKLSEIRRSLRCLGETLVQVYGRVEGGWPITVLGIEDHGAILAGNDALGASCGRPIEEVEIRLRPVPERDGNRGELCVRGDMTVGEYTDPDGWCSLGDIVRIDGEGYCYHEGRSDRMINTGYHVYPAEIEEAIAGVSGIADARVVGEANEKGAETVVAYLVLQPNGRPEALLKTVRDALETRLAKYKIPRVFNVVKELPPLP